MKYIIGMDGGGTATYVNVCKLDGTLLYEWKLGALNVNGQTCERAVETIKQVFKKIGTTDLKIKDCAGICVGAAGISNAKASLLIGRTLKEGGIEGSVLLVGDHETALAAAAEEMWGAILISGTGSICCGRDRTGNTYRAGGYGHLIDDEGSAYAVGRDILRAVVRGNDGREAHTILQEAVFSMLDCHCIEDMITWLYAPGRAKGEIASLAILLEAALQEDDTASKKIAHSAAAELFLLAKAVLVQMKECNTLVLGGSVLKKNRMIQETLTGLLHEDFSALKVVEMQNHAAYGAVKLIRKELGLL